MKKLIIILFALTSCISTEVIGFTEPIELADTTTKAKPHKPLPPRDTTDISDTTDGREQIGFNPTVEDWESADTVNTEI